MIEKALNQYIKYLEKEKQYSTHTIKAYEQILKNFLEYTKEQGINNLKEIDYSFLRNYLFEKNKNNPSSRTLCLIVSTIRGFFKYNYMEKKILENPALLLSTPKKEQTLPKFLYIDEMETLLTGFNEKNPIDQKNKLIIELLYSTGIRVSELVSITISDIYLEKQIIKIRGKGNKERYVLYGKEASHLLNQYIKQGRTTFHIISPYLFFNQKGNPMTTNSIRELLDHHARTCGIIKHVTPHMLRHSFATHMLTNGADLKSVQELLGHKNLSTTSIYTHVTNEQIRTVYLQNHPRARKK